MSNYIESTSLSGPPVEPIKVGSIVQDDEGNVWHVVNLMGGSARVVKDLDTSTETTTIGKEFLHVVDNSNVIPADEIETVFEFATGVKEPPEPDPDKAARRLDRLASFLKRL